MEPDVNLMSTMGILFVIAMALIIAWIGRSVVLKGMDMTLAKEQAMADLKHQQEYQRLAREAAHAQAGVAEQLKRLDSIEARLATIERILREVDEPVVARR